MNDFKSRQTRPGGDFPEEQAPAGGMSQVIAGGKGMGGVQAKPDRDLAE